MAQRLQRAALRVATEPGSPRFLDLLIDLEKGRSLLDLIAIELEIEEALQRPVDVITRKGLSSHLRERVLAEAIPL